MIKQLATLSLLFLLLTGGCIFSDDPSSSGGPPVVGYLAFDTPDNLVANLELALEAGDITGLRDKILYDGSESGDGRETFAPFEFYFDPNGESPGQSFPESIDYDCALSTFGHLLGGDPGMDHLGNPIPAVRSLAVGLFAHEDWSAFEADSLEGDPTPPGLLQCYFASSILFVLESNIGDSNINAWEVQDRALFHAIPVRVPDGSQQEGYRVEYRLWKWRDLITYWRRTDDSALSQILALYMDCEDPPPSH